MKLRKILFFVAVITAFLCVLSGCGNKEKETADTLETNEKAIEEIIEEEPKEIKPTFNNKIIDVMGKSYSEVKKIWGKSEKSMWYEGLIFSFDNSNVWFAFNGTEDETFSEPYENSLCRYAICELKAAVNNLPDVEYTAEELAEILDFIPESDGYSEYSGCYFVSFNKWGCSVVIEDFKETFTKESTIYIKYNSLY